MSLVYRLYQHLYYPCAQCQRSYRWCECGLPYYFTAEVLQYSEQSALACERWLL